MRTAVLAAALVVASGAFAGPVSQTVSPQGRWLADKLDTMGVETKWIAGSHIDWRSGLPDGRPELSPGRHTHCSAFVAAAAEALARLRGFACGKPDFAIFRAVHVFDLVGLGVENNAENGCSEDQLNRRGIPRLGRLWQNSCHYVPTKDRAAEEREDTSLLERRRESAAQ